MATNQVDQYTMLLDVARESYKNSHSPYSKFAVGAALLTADGKIFAGCNIEIVSYEGSMCAERCAIAHAVSQGHKDFKAIAVVCERAKDIWPCGVCRQYLAEFNIDMTVIVPTNDKSTDGYKTLPLSELLPHFFPPSANLPD
ncbi:MAG TPA: cytidine deaminase [Trichormus sp.]